MAGDAAGSAAEIEPARVRAARVAGPVEGGRDVGRCCRSDSRELFPVARLRNASAKPGGRETCGGRPEEIFHVLAKVVNPVREFLRGDSRGPAKPRR